MFGVFNLYSNYKLCMHATPFVCGVNVSPMLKGLRERAGNLKHTNRAMFGSPCPVH